MEKKICCFCETVFSSEAIFCGFCNEHKGVMTISEFEKTYC